MILRLLRKPNKVETEAEKMIENLNEVRGELYNFSTRRIIQLMKGSHQMGSGVINLEPIKGWYGYYGIDDTIVYYDRIIEERLYKEGIASYTNSAGAVVVTTSPERFKNMRNG